MSTNPFRIPTDAEIDLAQALGLQFHPDYRTFPKSGSDVANAAFEPAIALPGSEYLDLISIAETAWKMGGLKLPKPIP